MKVFYNLVIIFALCGCVTADNIQDIPKDEGSSKIYDYTYEKVYGATLSAVTHLPLAIEYESKEQGRIFLSKGASFFSWGEKVRILVEDLGGTKTRVRVLSKRALATNITAKDWTSEIFECISAEIGH